MDILVVDDEKSIREATVVAIEAEDHYAETATNATVALTKLKEDQWDLVILDVQLGDEDGLQVLEAIRKRHPKIPVVMFTAHGSVQVAVKAIQLGAIDLLEKPFSPEQLRAVLARVRKMSQMETKIEELETVVSRESPTLEFASEDPAVRDTYEVLFRAADTPATVLILGESGTGKSVVAKAVHERSQFKKKPLITVSCPSLSKELLESELFGHVKGAFTGAVADKVGKVKAAEGGTLFLDEIGELPMEIQPKLLRLLQEREYERVGDTKTRKANVRIIAATNKDLKQLVEEGTFREDLYYRLNVIAVHMPPLRARPKDLVHFAQSYVDFFTKQFGRPLQGYSEQAWDVIRNYDWPGNLRELRNVIERAVILAKGKEIGPSDLPSPHGGDQSVTNGSDSNIQVGANVSLEDLEREHIIRVVSRSENLTTAAETLGIDQATLYRKRKKFGMG